MTRGALARGAVLAAVLVLAVAVTAGGALLLLGRSGGGSGSGTATATGGPVAPPERGAWVGAWVQPEQYTDPGRVAAVQDFERQLGRPLDVVQVYHQWDDPWPGQDSRDFAAAGKVVLLSWSGTDTREIVAGVHDDLIRERARDLKAWGVPVLLRWQWEMDRPGLAAEMHGPAEFVAAWKHVRAIFADEGATNAAWVWCPLAVGFDDGRAQPYYPGDDEVDWLCADVYPGKDSRPFEVAAGAFLDWAAEHPQPIVIGEFGMRDKRGEKVRQRWLAATGDFVKQQPRIKALVYFDADRSNATPSYDMSLRNAPGSMRAFAALADDPYFDVRASP